MSNSKLTMRIFRSIIFRIEKIIIKKYWLKNNKHNNTILGDLSNLEAIDFVRNGGIVVGENTYGTINVNYTLGEKESLVIGNNCSIGRCNFLLGGEHDYSCISTFPFNGQPASSKGEIIVEDDVWIGDGVWILSGIKIGKGAIIGAGSIVTRDVPPFAIVAGNPAKVIKYRFSKDIIDKIMKIDLTSCDTSKKRVIEALDTKITSENIDRVLEMLK